MLLKGLQYNHSRILFLLTDTLEIDSVIDKKDFLIVLCLCRFKHVFRIQIYFILYFLDGHTNL